MILRNRFLRFALPLTLLVFLSGGSLYYWHSSSVRLTADGHTRRIFTKAPEVKGFLEEQRIVLGPSDFTSPPLDSPVGHNTAVKITRVTMDILIETSTGTPVVTWQTRTRQNLRLVLVQKGTTSILKKKIQITRHDGIEISRATLAETASRLPFHTLTLFDKNGQPAKKYNLLKLKQLKMRATGYFVGEKTVPSDTTFLGYKLRRGLAAVDPKTIPLRSRLYVEGYGYAYAADTGSAIKKLRIDLAVKDRREEARYNRKNVPVYILEKARTW